jgi:hypothetical protein
MQTVEPQSVMTTEKEVVEPPIIKPNSTSARNIFSKTNAVVYSLLYIHCLMIFYTANYSMILNIFHFMNHRETRRAKTIRESFYGYK